MRLEVDLRLSRYRMRTLALDDALFLLSLRQHPKIKPYVNDTSPFLEDQLMWIQQTLAATNDFSFVFERDDQRTGSASLYEIDWGQKRGRMGRWLVKPGSLCAPMFAFMGYDFCFARFGLSRISAKIPSDNEAAIRFQKRIGASRVGTSTALLHGEASTLVEFELTSSGWARARAVLLPLVDREVARGRRGEPAPPIVAARG